jgi:hypothetical protein
MLNRALGKSFVASLILIPAVTGCTSGRALLVEEIEGRTLHGALELEQTPFFPQEDYQCGPAALATVLVFSGVATTPDRLVARVYIPDRRGSLQVELLAAARNLGRVAYVIEAEFGALIAELNAGRPVLVLQNLGAEFAPVWHYAVVIGYDSIAGNIVLRSGTRERRVMPANKFLRTWARGDHWAMIVLRPGEMPAKPEESTYLQAAAAMEIVGKNDAAVAAFVAAAETWPDSPMTLFGLANAYYATGNLGIAEYTYRSALSKDPQNPAILNNLAQLLTDRNRCIEAQNTIDHALDKSISQPNLRAEIADSKREIYRRCAANSSGR